MKQRKQFFILLLVLIPLLFNARVKMDVFLNQKTQAMDTKEEQLVKEFLMAVQTGDLPKIDSLLHPRVQWLQPGNNLVSGHKQSSPKVFEMVGTMFKISANTLKLSEIKWVSANGSSVAALLRWTATTPSGKTLDVENIDIYTVEKGKIVAVKIYSSNLEEENQFWNQNQLP